jgi:Fe-S-cluster containining protein
MNTDFSLFYERYEALREQADAAFARTQGLHPDLVRCSVGCADCCYALFDVTLIEAMYINHRFGIEFGGTRRDTLLERCNQADRAIYRIKRRAYQQLSDGGDENAIIGALAREKVRCPLLTDQNRCEIYSFRPITCRLYGVPLRIGSDAHTCGLSGFEKGVAYPTVHVDVLQNRLANLSADMVERIGSRHLRMGNILVPLSMALLTNYDESYLGIEPETTQQDDAAPAMTRMDRT